MVAQLAAIQLLEICALPSGSGITASPTSRGASGTGAGIASNASSRNGNSASETECGIRLTAPGRSSLPNAGVQNDTISFLATSSGSTNSFTVNSTGTLPPGSSLLSIYIFKSSVNAPQCAGKPTSTTSIEIAPTVTPPPVNLSTDSHEF